jgi:hypothetical protein
MLRHVLIRQNLTRYHFQLANMPACKHANLQTCQLENMPTCKHANLKTCQLENMPTYKHVNLQTCKLANLKISFSKHDLFPDFQKVNGMSKLCHSLTSYIGLPTTWNHHCNNLACQNENILFGTIFAL